MNARTREGFYTLWTIAILICLALCIFLLAYVSIVGGGETAQTLPAEAGADSAALPAAGDGTVQAVPEGQDQAVQPADQAALPADQAVQPAEEAAQPPADLQSRLVFLGDSTTYGLYAYGVLPHWQVWTPASGTLSLFNWAVETVEYYQPGDDQNPSTLSIADAAATGQPEYLIITLGINGVSFLDEAGFKDYYLSLVQAIQQASPNTRIYCNSIYPVIDGNAPSDITNEKINTANGWIQDVASQTGTAYLNSREALADGSGGLAPQFIDEQNDGIHMNVNGYIALLQYVNASLSQ